MTMDVRTETASGWAFARPGGRSPIAGLEVAHYRDVAGAGFDFCMLPQPSVSLTVVLDGELRLDGSSTTLAGGGFSGPGARSARLHGRDLEFLEIYLAPATAYRVLGRTATELAGSIVGLDELRAPTWRRLRDAILSAADTRSRFVAVRDFVGARVGDPHEVDPEVEFSLHRIDASGGRVRVSELAASTGWSRRKLWARFTAQVGVTPKRMALVTRLNHAIQGLSAGLSPAVAAARWGYADQSHLNRDMREFAQVTPGALARHRHELGYVSGSVLEAAGPSVRIREARPVPDSVT